MSFKTNIVSFLQALVCLVFLLTKGGSLMGNPIQFASLSLSLLMISVSQVGLAYEYEISTARNYPQEAEKGKIYGIFSNFYEKPLKCASSHVGLFFLILGSSIGTLFALTTTAIVFGVWVPFAIVSIEGVGNVIAQACRGQLFRANLVGDYSSAVRIVDATLFHLLITYPGMAFAPTIQYRHPDVVGGAYFTIGCLYARVRNFVLLGESAERCERLGLGVMKGIVEDKVDRRVWSDTYTQQHMYVGIGVFPNPQKPFILTQSTYNLHRPEK